MNKKDMGKLPKGMTMAKGATMGKIMPKGKATKAPKGKC